MAEENKREACSGRRAGLAVGALLVLVTTTVPYLTLINSLFFAGIFISGVLAAYYYIVTCQVRLTASEAFVFSSLSGTAGAVLSVLVSYVLLTGFGYRPGIEGLMLLIEWTRTLSPEQDELVRQLENVMQAPVRMTYAELFVSMAVTVFLYAPVSGLGGMFIVWRLKRQASRGDKA
ncbi:hypothetical protein CHL67_10035 [Prosthecochloris sp. GSB1]|uniref:hypothetical protein n=1 Tax=Prosthecochloris sp. GSB1 TaxID=281093 RepID=UPI000B8CEB93|nr:hypothetical protein [Prosthecochloris sp. GSB1]ASQ91205.1 hypothetical protein CHL67_10035 [Prosthecochloris sp. GSB1]